MLDTDYYCSFFVWSGPLPEAKVIGAERQAERILLGDTDIAYIDKGLNQGVAKDQLFLLMQMVKKFEHPRTGYNYGPLMWKRGRGRVIHADPDRAVLRLEKTCGAVMLDNYAVPFVEKEGPPAKDQGFTPYQTRDRSALVGEVIFLSDDLNQVATGGWALVDVGEEDGLKMGQQMNVFRYMAKNLPRHSVANSIIIDVQRKTATIKILSAIDVTRIGDEVEIKAETK